MRRTTDGARRRRIITGVALAALFAPAGWCVSGAGTALAVFEPVDRPDTIVILASHEWERLPAAVALAREHPSAAVLLTVPVEITDKNCHLCLGRSELLTTQGVAPERIRVLPDRVRNTHDEAFAVRQYAERSGTHRLAVVTSPYHTRRALATFRQAFTGLPVAIGVYPACTHSPARPTRWWMSKYDRAYVAYEWAAAVQYRINYGVPLGIPADGGLPGSISAPLSGSRGCR